MITRILVLIALFTGFNAFAMPNLEGTVDADLPFMTVLPDDQDTNLFYTFPQTYDVCGKSKPEFSLTSYVVNQKPHVVIEYNLCPTHQKFGEAEKTLRAKYPKAKLIFIPYKSLIAGKGLWRLLFDGVDVDYHCAPVTSSKVGKVSCQISAQDEKASSLLYKVFADSTIFALNGYFDRVFEALKYDDGGMLKSQQVKDSVAFGVWGMKDHPELLKKEWKPSN